MQKQHSPDSLLESGHRWSDQHPLVLNTVNLYFQGWFVSISRGKFLESWQLISWPDLGIRHG